MNTAPDNSTHTRYVRRQTCVVLGLILAQQLSVCGHDQTRPRDPGKSASLFASAPIACSECESPRIQIVPADRQPKVGTSPMRRLPGFSPVSRKRNYLVNYFHMDLADSRINHLSERLAQWDVLILNHDLVQCGKVSLDRMRRTNPNARILAWVPLQGPNNGLIKGIPKKGDHDWYARRIDGSYFVPHWGGNLMNPSVQNRAWIRHVLQYVRDTRLGQGRYDGLLPDCLWHQPPSGLDVNGDNVCDQTDEIACQESMLFLLRELRAIFPTTILVGNGGLPWPAQSRYYDFVNGCMHENALGDQVGGDWKVLWNSYLTALSRIKYHPVFYLIQVALRADGRSQKDAMCLTTLTENDRRRFRLGLGTTLLLDGGYFGFDRGDYLHGQLWWFEEYDIDLGKPTTEHQHDRFGPGSLSRDFQNGIVIVNSTETSVDVSVESNFPPPEKKSSTKTVVLHPWDATIFVKPAPGSKGR